MGIADNEHNQELYHRIMEQGEDLGNYLALGKVKELAEEIYKQLLAIYIFLFQN